VVENAPLLKNSRAAHVRSKHALTPIGTPLNQFYP
jgi:hypothetical protein